MLPWSDRLHARRDQDGKWIAGATRTGRHSDVVQSSVGENSLQPRWREPKPAIAKPIANPRFLMLPQIEDQGAAPRYQNARRLAHNARGILGVMQRLRQQRDVDCAVFDRQPLQQTS